jgi:hypothetical protein
MTMLPKPSAGANGVGRWQFRFRGLRFSPPWPSFGGNSAKYLVFGKHDKRTATK